MCYLSSSNETALYTSTAVVVLSFQPKGGMKKMAFLEGAIGLGVGVLVGLALLKYSGYVDALKKELGYIASGAVFLILASVLEPVGTQIPSIATAISWISIIFWVIAFILVLIGAIAMAIQIFSKLK
jgi:uncharacterized Tic20 family protein